MRPEEEFDQVGDGPISPVAVSQNSLAFHR